MRSYINRLTDYTRVERDWNAVIPSPKEQVEKELRQLTRKAKYTVPVETLEAGDVAIVKLESDIPRFNKKTVPVTVMGGLLDKALEEKLVGRAVGESFTATLEQGNVAVTVVKATRTLYPEPTDEMVIMYAEEHDEFSGITTVAEYVERVKAEYLRDMRSRLRGEAMQDIMRIVLTTSDWIFDEDEVNQLVNRIWDEDSEQLMSETGKTPEELTPEELKRATGFDSLDELKHFMHDSSEQWIACLLWWGSVNGIAPELSDLDRIDFKFLEDYVDANIIYTEE